MNQLQGDRAGGEDIGRAQGAGRVLGTRLGWAGMGKRDQIWDSLNDEPSGLVTD